MESRTVKLRIIILLLFLLIFVLLIIYQSNWFWRFFYPLKYEELIIQNAKKYQLDPYLIASIIFVESRFDSRAHSHKGARGLMQIMPETGQWIAEQKGIEDFHPEDLYRPEVNIEFGCWYLISLLKEFDEELIITLAAYNAGRGNVNKWLGNNWDGREATLADLPYPETRNFVRKIFRVYKKYKRIYNMNIQ